MLTLDPKVKKSAFCVVAVVSLLGSFALGRSTAPIHTEEKIITKTVEVEKVKTEWKDKLVVQKVYVESKKKNVIREEHETIKPDGTIERTKTEQVVAESNTSEHALVDVSLVGTQTQDTRFTSTTTLDKKTIPNKNWNVSVLVGVAPRADFMPPLGPTPLVGGIHVQHRFIGPVFAGGWVLTSPGVGVSLGLEF